MHTIIKKISEKGKAFGIYSSDNGGWNYCLSVESKATFHVPIMNVQTAEKTVGILYRLIMNFPGKFYGCVTAVPLLPEPRVTNCLMNNFWAPKT